MSKLVLKFESADSRGDTYADNWYDSEYPQGSTGELYRIYELRPEGRLFKMEGFSDSYGEVSWGKDDMKEVVARPSQAVIYDYVGE